MSFLSLDVITPEGELFSGNITSLTAPGELGSFAILPRHRPMMASLQVGSITITMEDGVEKRDVATSGGVVEVLRTGITILAETAEFADEIDVERAEAARERAATRRLERSADIDTVRLDAALGRAINRLRVAGR